VASVTPQPGFVDPLVAGEFPGLRLRWVTIPARRGASPPALRAQLRDLANRYRGGGVVTMRTKPIPHAFRAFFRQIGLDPDVRRIPSEEVAVARLVQGGFVSVDLVADACLVALIETGVPVWALDADRVDDSGLCIRTAAADEAAGPGDAVAPRGSLVVADGATVHAVLFEDPGPGHGVGSRTRRVMLFAVAVDGVPEIHVEEALWCAVELL
jgi:DNA/RNA-binding domain of Phe-tRNA-synthetase-like protein